MKPFWDKERHYFSKKICVLFGILALATFVLNLTLQYILKGEVWSCLILLFLTLIFIGLAFGKIIEKLFL